ncbi:hypothetical protein SG34_033145 [Thalassomonas viridans]|uniref:Organic solvent tolerance-like N-terminal domain-containing protein n=1 Tax=Thalassomonas viridans TaxID=137584 RepID=A0AAE9ZA63_9GAMM|nr:hypothetical protein [Thalassomonas viridans]WDE08749.1 hypothetical protein SG34_033145 [Thalassomonas viridans]
MKKMTLLGIILSSFFTQTVMAENIYLSMNNMTNSQDALILEMMTMTGPIDNITGESALFSTKNHNAIILDSDMLIKDIESLSKGSFAHANSIIITGSAENNVLVSQHLLGYSNQGDYLIIKGINSDSGIELIHFDKNDSVSLQGTAKSLIKAAVINSPKK